MAASPSPSGPLGGRNADWGLDRKPRRLLYVLLLTAERRPPSINISRVT